MKRYGGNLSIFEKLSFRQAQQLICTAIQESGNDLMKLRWIISGEPAGYSWEEYRIKLKEANEEIRPQTAEEILDEIGEKMAAFGW